jgi:hypothetical protein
MVMKIKKKTGKEKMQGLANLLYLEIDRILLDMETRKDLLFKLWSKERVREPLLRVLRSHYYELDFELLLLLPHDLNKHIDSFYRVLDDFIFYVSYTEDMPQTMNFKFDAFVKNLKDCAVKIMPKLQKLSGCR